MSIKSRNRIVALVLVSLALVILVGVKKYSTVLALRQQVEVGSLDWLAQDAQANGLQGVNIPTFEWSYFAVEGFNDAAADYSVLIAQPVGKTSYVWNNQNQVIGTWYRFKIIETLSQKPYITCDICPPSPDPPLGILNADEIFVPKMGGTVVINGITINSIDPDFPEYSLNQNYLLFLDVDATKKVDVLSAGPIAAFAVDANGNLTPVTQLQNPLKEDIATLYGSSLGQLRAALNGGTIYRDKDVKRVLEPVSIVLGEPEK
jgi:hypothetical protein